MADITMCNGTDCPLKEKCLRYLSSPGGWQSYFQKIPYSKRKKACAEFIMLLKKKRVKES